MSQKDEGSGVGTALGAATVAGLAGLMFPIPILGPLAFLAALAVCGAKAAVDAIPESAPAKLPPPPPPKADENTQRRVEEQAKLPPPPPPKTREMLFAEREEQIEQMDVEPDYKEALKMAALMEIFQTDVEKAAAVVGKIQAWRAKQPK